MFQSAAKTWILGATIVALAAVFDAPALAQRSAPAAQERGSRTTVARTPWGDPDLQGTWDFTTITPLQRPPELAGREFLTDAEAAKIEKQINQQRFQTEEQSPGSLGGTPRPESDPGIYNLGWWWEPNGRKLVRTRRSSLVIDPPDGRIPPLTPHAQAVMKDRDAARERSHAAADLPLAERCVMGFNAGPPMVPGPYNNLVQLFQSPGYVVIVNEMVHDARIVPLDPSTLRQAQDRPERSRGTTSSESSRAKSRDDGRPRVGEAIRFWAGDSRGRWEGNTLVVETRNFTDNGTGTFGLPGLIDRNLVLVERFTRVDDRTLTYAFTVEDPTVWTRPWSAEVPMTRIDGFVMEYACHEGNYGLANILSGARSAEKAR